MRDDLEVFENRRDDWLAKERAYEETVSVWDFDEGKKIKAAHQKNCDSYSLKREHELKHQSYNVTHNRGLIGENKISEYRINWLVKIIVASTIGFTLLITIITIAATTDVIDFDEIGFAVPIIMFIVLALCMPGNNKRRKK